MVTFCFNFAVPRKDCCEWQRFEIIKWRFKFYRIMEEQQRVNSEIGLEERSGILQAWADFKDAIFNVLFVILDKKAEEEEEESLIGLAFESGLDFLQIMAFPFNSLVIDAWNGGDSLGSLARLFNQMSISTYLPGAPFSAFLVMLYGLIFIILLIVLDIVYVSYSFSRKKFRFTFPLVILAQVVPLFVTVLFLPITETLLNVVSCEQLPSDEWVMTSFPNVECWRGWHLFHTSITLLFSALFVLISTVVALALFEPRMTTGKLTARKNSNGQVVFIINKIVLQFIFTFSPFDGTAFYVTVIFLLSFWQFWCYSIKNPYHTKTASKFFKICSTYYFWTALMLFVGQVLGGYGFDGALVIWMSGLPFFAIIIYFQNGGEFGSLLASNLKFKSGEQLEAHISYLLQLVATQATDRNSYMLLIGYIEKHKEVCNEADCPLKSEVRRRRGEESMEHNCQLVFRQVERMFRAGIKKFPECTKLRLSFAFFQLEQLRNKERAYEEFSGAVKLQTTFQQQFTIYRFKKIIRENLQEREEKDSDLIETIRFENHVALLEESMVKSAKLQKEFWSELKEEVPDLKKLNQIGAHITQATNNISENYRQLSKINAASCEVLYSYSQYLMLVSQDYTEGREMLANARKIFLDRQSGTKRAEVMHFHEDSYNRMTSPLLILTASHHSTPRIANINLVFTEVTGYQREELIDREVNKVSPRLWEREGLSCFQLIQAQDRQGFLLHKFGHLLTVNYSVSHRPEVEEWHIVFKLSATSSMKMVLLADLQGHVTDCNVLAETALRAYSSPSTPLRCTLSDLGLSDFTSQRFHRQSGSPAEICVGNKRGEGVVQIEPLTARIYGENTQADDEEERMVVTSEKHIGYKVCISRNEHVHKEEREFQEEESTGRREKSSKPLDDGVLQLYENRSAIDDFMQMLEEEKETEVVEIRFQLKEKIKTMRLLDNEIKMVYAQGGQNDYSDAAGNGQGDDERELFKFDDEGYQAKLRAAINTNLNHIQVSNLRKASLLFLLLLFALNALQLYLSSLQVDNIDSYIHQISRRSSEYSLLTSNIMAAIDSSANYSNLYQTNAAHQVEMETDIMVNLQLENNLTVSRNLKDAVIMLNSRLISYFSQPTSPLSISSIFVNYITAIYPAFLNYPGSAAFDLVSEYLLAAGVGVIALVMMWYWIYISLLIDKKRYDIMIWFLDIPVNYVAYLGSHCDKFLKEFATTKELAQRGISTEDDDDNFQEYSAKKHENEDEEIEEQIKARKSLISKNKRETLVSKMDLTSLKVLWVLVYSLSFSILMLVQASGYSIDFNFLLPQWMQTSQAITIDSTLYLTLQMKSHNISAGNTNLTALANTLELDHKGVIAEYSLEDFNYNILTFHLTDVSSIYNTIYFSNICGVLPLAPANLTQCQNLVGSKLKIGYEVYSKYLIAPEDSMNDQIWLANQLYVIPALLQMLTVWENSLIQQGNGFINLCSIMLYVFIIVSVLCFLLLWLYYLRKLNRELNQTIQMLNMIPFKLLPKSRKQTKMFIAWIIREANKTKHDNQ